MVRLGIAAEGGGLRAGAVGAMIFRLEQKILHKYKNPITFLGSSGSVGSVMYRMSHGQISIKNLERASRYIWTEALADKSLVDTSRLFSQNPIMDVKYLTETIFRKENALYSDHIRASKDNFVFPVCRVRDRALCYLVKREVPGLVNQVVVKDHDLYQVMRACKSIPVLDNRSVAIYGVEYVDGGVLAAVPYVDLGSDSKCIVLLSKPGDEGRSHAIGKWLSMAVGGNVLQLFKQHRLSPFLLEYLGRAGFRRRALLRNLRTLEQEGRVLVIEPHTALGGRSDNSSEALKANYAIGIGTIDRRLDEIQRFLEL